MSFIFTCRLQSIPKFNRSLRKIQHLKILSQKIPLREFCSEFQSKYQDGKYGELKTRLAAIPYLDLLDKEVDTVLQGMCHDDDERLGLVFNRCSEVFNYNARTGRRVRSQAFLKAYCTYGYDMDDNTWNHWDSEKWRLAAILAWCIELFGLFHVMLDDIMDQTISRRGKPCWYMKPDVGLRAINDTQLFLCGVYKLLRKHFSGFKNYANILHEFLQIDNETVCGQCLDMHYTKNKKHKLEEFTFEKYEPLAIYKTAHHTYRLPVHLAMHLDGRCSAKDFEFTRNLCLKIGVYFQCHDDKLDCFGGLEDSGMIGNDIREGKCTWLSVKFLEVASEALKKQFQENYGIDDADAIAKVVELYRKNNLLERFKEFDEISYTEISSLIESMNDTKGALFYDLFNQVRNRKIPKK